MNLAYFPAFHLCWLLLTMMLLGCPLDPQETELKGEVTGLGYHIKLVLDGIPVTAERVRNEVSSVLVENDAKFSSHRGDSEISRINAQETTDWLPVSREVAQFVDIAHTVYEHSDGCYDLTISPLLALRESADQQNRVPKQEQIDILLPHMGMPLLEVDTVNQRIRKKDPKLTIDVSSIAQAYSAGLVARRLESLGVNNYWVEIGGDLMLKGHTGNGHHWWVSMDTPKPLSMDIQKLVNNREQNGVAIMKVERLQHPLQVSRGGAHPPTLNPKTGWPVTNYLQSVTVMHENPVWAKAWNSALQCVGEREAARIADAENLKVLFIYHYAHEFQEHISKAFVAVQ